MSETHLHSPAQLTQASKFLSFVLRHQPEAIGITLDSEGWAEIATLIEAAAGHGQQLSPELVAEVVATSDKKRFAVSSDGARIRAVQGHSTPSVDISFAEKVSPAILFHGTASRSLAAILREGLRPQQRQYVHLSQDVATATSVGQRYGTPVVLSVAAGQLQRDGHRFFQADNGVWLVADVPPAYLSVTADD
jgi:putative RNA 2'-phosphotransferase